MNRPRKTFYKSIFKPCALYPLRYFSVSENHVKDGGTVSRRNGKHMNQMKMLKLSKRELNILKIISKRIRYLGNNLFSFLRSFAEYSVNPFLSFQATVDYTVTSYNTGCLILKKFCFIFLIHQQ